jgi:rhodanese-related sulfurtransferase
MDPLNAAFISVSNLKSILSEAPEGVIIIDVRNPDEYEKLHIPGAVNIPGNELDKHIDELAAASKIVTACGSGGNRCKIGAAKLRELGIADASYLQGGTLAWYEDQE